MKELIFTPVQAAIIFILGFIAGGCILWMNTEFYGGLQTPCEPPQIVLPEPSVTVEGSEIIVVYGDYHVVTEDRSMSTVGDTDQMSTSADMGPMLPVEVPNYGEE